MGAREQAEQDLRDRCFYAGLGEHDTEMCIDYFIRKLNHKEMAAEYKIEIQSSTNKKSIFKQMLGL